MHSLSLAEDVLEVPTASFLGKSLRKATLDVHRASRQENHVILSSEPSMSNSAADGSGLCIEYLDERVITSLYQLRNDSLF